MGPVQVHQISAQVLEHGGRYGRAVHELLVRAGSDDTANDERLAIERIQAGLRENGIHRLRLLEVKDRLHTAGLRAGADESLVGTLAQNELERAHDDGLAGTGLTRDTDQA